MARKAIIETGYTFTPGASGIGSVSIPRVIPRERLILITNVTANTVIYNFSDSNLKASSYTTSGTPNSNNTNIILNSSTTGMSSTDKLQIIVDEYDEKFTPSETYIDPVNKFRVSEPQALIDTDFEYGTQITKWENLSLINNRPFAYNTNAGITTISSISYPTGSKTVTVTLQVGSSRPGVGTAITVQDTFLSPANGNYIVETTPSATTFTYTARSANTTSITDVFDSNKTGIFSGTTYTNAKIGGTPTYTIGSGSPITGIVTVTTTVPHGLAIGNEVAIRGTSASTNPPNGSFSIVRIPTNTSFCVYPPNAPTGSISGGEIFVRPQGQVLHRPFDGGVIFSSNANANFETTIRQTRRYFRYQSGKGIQVSSGTILKPNLQVDSITSVGTGVTVITKEQHNIQPGTTITVSGVNETAYNGTFTVNTIKGYNTFEYTMAGAASSTVASGTPYVSVSSWHGASNRLGIFDDQNGIFFEFDGQQLYTVRRNSTFQLSGKISVNNGDNTVSQTSTSFPTFFSKQLLIGNFVVIRGQSYRVTDIASDTSLTISPSYRGASITNAIISKTVDTRTAQSQWNIDKCDGTGPSGYNLDLTKMQMFYIDYSWYGAGFIRWGFRGSDGNVIYCHKVANNNVNTEAYMRSGNLPARYESQALPPTTQLVSTLSNIATTISVASTSGFPSSGTLVIRDATIYEYVNYAGMGAGTNTFTGVRRAQSGSAPSLTISSGSNVATATTTNIQVGMRAVHPSIPDGTFVSSIGVGNLTLSQSATNAISAGIVTFPAMGAITGQTFTLSTTNPVAVELAFPTFGPTISHWGTSVIMDGRFDDDKSLIFTYGQTSVINVPTTANANTRALLGIRVSPSVDNGIAGAFGTRELINRLQLTLDSIGISLRSSGNVLITAILNGTPVTTSGTAPNWTNAVGNVAGRQNSSLAQIVDFSGTTTTVTGGEQIAGFFVSSTDRLDLSGLRDLGNSILGGGGTNPRSEIYPDGPDTLIFVVTNIGQSASDVTARLSWKEAQA